MIETTFSNLVDSCPPWAQAYLSDELIDDQDAMDQDEKEAEKLIGDAIFSENDVSRRKLLERARLLSSVKDREFSSIRWHAYPTSNEEARNKIDEKQGVLKTNWAHEQLLKSVYDLTTDGPTGNNHYWIGGKKKKLGPRWMDRSEVVVGTDHAAHMYKQWFIEHWEQKGIGNEGQLCTCVNMWKYADKTSSFPGYVNAQGV